MDTATLDKTTLEYELNSLLAEEYQAWYQYFQASPFLVGRERPSLENKFVEFATDELSDHAVKLLKRIEELGFSNMLKTPEDWKIYSTIQSHVADYNTEAQISLNIESETSAIAHYQLVIELAEALNDYVTADMLKSILADEQEHLAELLNYKNDLNI